MADRYERALFLSAASGMDGNVAPDLLKDSQVARLINCSTRGGKLATRPRFVEHPTGIATSRFQGSAVYRLQGVDRIVYVLSGSVFVLNLDTGITLNVATFPTQDFELAYFCQVDKYFVIQNGIYDPIENWPIILYEDTVFDNTTATYYDSGTSTFKTVATSPDPSRYRLPIGKSMAYGQGRLFTFVERFKTTIGGSAYIQGNGLRYIIGADILQADNVTGVLVTAEYATGNNGNIQVFGMPWEIGLGTSLGFFRNSFTGTGLGPLVAMCREGSAAFSVDLPRDEWVDSTTGSFGKVLFFNSGSDSPWALIPVNDDLPYRGRDGLRTIKYTQSTEANSSGSLSNVPYSSEVDTFLRRDTREFLPWVSMAFVENRVLLTSGGYSLTTNYGVGFDTIISLDTSVFNSISASRPSRAFDGAWTGPIFLSVLSARMGERDRAFVFCKDRNAPRLFLAYLDDTAVVDFDSGRPVARMYSREFNFDNYVIAKMFEWADLWFSEVEGTLDITVYWRQDNVSVWHPCHTRRLQFCDGSLMGAGAYIRIKPDEAYEKKRSVSTGTLLRMGMTHQFCVQWKGKAKLNRAVFAAKLMTDAADFTCETPEECLTVEVSDWDIVLNDFTVYQV